MASELLYWRPVLAGKCSLAEIKAGTYTLVDLLKINALMDMQDDVHEEQMKNTTKGGRTR